MKTVLSRKSGELETGARAPSRRGQLGAIAGMLAVISADLASKAAANAWAPPHTEANIGLVGVVRPVWNDQFSLELWGTSPTEATLLMAVVAIAGTALALRLSMRGYAPVTLVALGAGGAFANLTDRALHGAVADFLVTGPIVINLADLAVAAAVLSLWYRTLRPQRRREVTPPGMPGVSVGLFTIPPAGR